MILSSVKNHNKKLKSEKCNKYMAENKTIVGAWMNIDEFKKVYDLIYSKAFTLNANVDALHHIRLWILRRGTLCPAFIFGTEVILNVKIWDFRKDNELDEWNLKILYGSAITRFFNFMSSTIQKHKIRTMYDTATILKLNSFVVDVRHLCAHNQVLPDLSVLRYTINYCLDWLQRYYWVKLYYSICDVQCCKIISECENYFILHLLHIFGVYNVALQCFILGVRNIKTAKKNLSEHEFQSLKQFCIEHNCTELKNVLRAVVKNISNLIKKSMTIKERNQLIIKSILNEKSFLAREVDENSIEISIETTRSFFRMLSVNGLIEDLFNSLLNIVEESGSDARGEIFWAIQIGKGIAAHEKCREIYSRDKIAHSDTKYHDFIVLNSEHVPNKVSKPLHRAGINIKRSLLFGDSIQNPRNVLTLDEPNWFENHIRKINKGSAFILTTILPFVMPNLSSKKFKIFKEIVDAMYISLNNIEIYTTSNSEIIYTADDLFQCFKKLNDPKNSNSEDSIWKPLSEIYGDG